MFSIEFSLFIKSLIYFINHIIFLKFKVKINLKIKDFSKINKI